MIRKTLVHSITRKPTDSYVHLSLTHQLPVMDDALEKARKHQTQSTLRVYTGTTVVLTIGAPNLIAKP